MDGQGLIGAAGDPDAATRGHSPERCSPQRGSDLMSIVAGTTSDFAKMSVATKQSPQQPSSTASNHESDPEDRRDDGQDLRTRTDQSKHDIHGSHDALPDHAKDGGTLPTEPLVSAEEAQPTTKPQICFDFTKGMCLRGDKCKFSHDLATIVQFNSKEKGICFDYLRNQCQRGLLCRFSHDLSTIAQQCQVYNGVPPAAAAPKVRSNAICYDFVKGVCQRGSECRYSHDLSLIARTARGGTNCTRTGEICYDYLRGRCAYGASCKYSHAISFLGGAGYYPAHQSMLPAESGGGMHGPGDMSGGGRGMVLQHGHAAPGFHQGHGMQQPAMMDGSGGQFPYGMELDPQSGGYASHQEQQQMAAMWPRQNAHFPQQQPRPPPAPGNAPVYNGQQQQQQQCGGQFQAQQQQQQQQGVGGGSFPAAHQQGSSRVSHEGAAAAASAHAQAAAFHGLHSQGLAPPSVATLMPRLYTSQEASDAAGGLLTRHSWSANPGQAPSHHPAAASALPPAEADTPPQGTHFPTQRRMSAGAQAPDAKSMAMLPPSLLPLLKEIWSKQPPQPQDLSAGGTE